jgi:dihydroxy-acid dehydratase
MGGISANKPILPLITGPMLPGSHRGQRIGACTDCRNNWAAFRAGEIDVEEISAINEELAPTVCADGLSADPGPLSSLITMVTRLDRDMRCYGNC